MSWFGFAAIFVAFFVTHSVPVRPKVRAGLVRKLGARGFTISYSALSIGMLAVVIAAAGRAPFVQIWPQAPWQHLVVMAGMFAVSLVLAFTLGRPNPFSFGGARNDSFDPRTPGIVAWVRHPVLVVLGAWALLHLLPNGDLAHVILFGVFASFAALGGRLIDRRKQREMGQERWEELWAATQSARVQKPRHWGVFCGRIAAAIIVYLLLFGLHPVLIGVPIY